MKKFLAILLTLVLVLVNVAAWAADTGDDPSTWTSAATTFSTNGFKKTYSGSTILPDETLAFVSTPDDSNPDKTDAANLTIADYKATAATGYLTVNVPSYSKVGVYKYTIAETAGSSQGVTYSTDTVGLTVMVTYNYTDKKLDTTIGITKNADNKKADEFTNTYEMNDLTVKKTVAGNMGDQSQLFDITVTLTAEDKKTVNSDITITGSSDAGSNQTVAKGWSGAKVLNLKIKHGDTITLANIPTGVTYAVAEADAHKAEDPTGADGSKGYTITYSGASGTIAATGTFEATITNTKEMTIDTGITMDTVPYIMILALVLIGAAVMFIRKREEY